MYTRHGLVTTVCNPGDVDDKNKTAHFFPLSIVYFLLLMPHAACEVVSHDEILVPPFPSLTSTGNALELSIVLVSCIP